MSSTCLTSASMTPSAACNYRHPLEWFFKDRDNLFAQHLRYRELATAAIFRRPDNEHELGEIHGMLDLVHLRYLAQHAPDSAVQFPAANRRKSSRNSLSSRAMWTSSSRVD